MWHSIHLGPGLMMIVMKISLPIREGREVVDFGKLDVEVSWAGWVNGCHSTHNTYTVYTQYIVSPHLDRSGIFRSAILMHSWITGKSFRAASHTQDLLFRQRCVTIFSLVS